MDKNRQVIVMYFLVHMGLIFFMYPADIIASTDQAHWIPILVGIITHFTLVFIYLKGLSYFPNRSIISIYSQKGKIISFLFLIPILLYFLMSKIIIVRAFAEIINIVFLSKTPLWAVMALMISISCYLAMLGIDTIFRTGFVFSILLFPLILFILMVSLQNIDLHYVFPLWNSDLSFLTDSSFYKTFLTIGGGFLFLGFIQPTLTFQRKKILISLIVIIPCFILSVYVPILTYGQATTETFIFPFVMTLDSIKVDWLMFDRVTMFFILSLITFIMLFISLILWKTMSIVHHYLPFIKPNYVVLFLSLLVYSICLYIPSWDVIESLFIWSTPLRLYVIFTVPLSIITLGFLSKIGGYRQNV
ncbi:GerAB/ArcD/ProY family transporter [Bacillus sp. RO2]|uniref:GerAB/ArcD/ProY family transporter n=1 Tax=Bacillus sp. RO2 TaxID=2723913 RepID=UPI003216AA1C